MTDIGKKFQALVHVSLMTPMTCDNFLQIVKVQQKYQGNNKNQMVAPNQCDLKGRTTAND